MYYSLQNNEIAKPHHIPFIQKNRSSYTTQMWPLSKIGDNTLQASKFKESKDKSHLWEGLHFASWSRAERHKWGTISPVHDGCDEWIVRV